MRCSMNRGRLCDIVLILSVVTSCNCFWSSTAFSLPSSTSRWKSKVKQKPPTVTSGCTLSLDYKGGEVLLVGCSHGSACSANDVAKAIGTDNSTDVIVLELCGSRFKSLRRYIDNTENEAASRRREPLIRKYMRGILETADRQGWQTALTTGLLQGVSALQTIVLGTEPGAEFVAAIRSVNHTDVILADRAAEETIRRLTQFPRISVRMFQDQLICKNWHKSPYRTESKVLRTAIFGGDRSRVSLPTFLIRNRSAVVEIVKLGALALVSTRLLEGAVASVLAATWAAPIESSEIETVMLPQEVLVLVIWDFILFGIAYLAAVLPITRIILSERDERLADGIRTARNLVVRESPRIVAVLGFLHVNGVAEHLLKDLED